MNDWWNKLVVSLELADLSDADTRARLDSAAAKVYNQGLQAASTWQYAPALRILTAAIEVWTRLENVPGEVMARNTRGGVYRKLGDTQAALDDHAAARDLADEFDVSSGAILARCGLGAALIEQGDLEKAEPPLIEALALAEAAGDTGGAGQAQGWLGRLHEARKHWDAARDAYAAALVRWQSVQAPGIEAMAGLARVALSQAYTMDALALADRILQHVAEHGPARLDEPLRVYWTLYRVFRIAGQTDDARDLLGAAHHLLERQARGLTETERARFMEEVPLNREIVAALASG
jgi:tetratricopeptide (TPR) repeat protein